MPMHGRALPGMLPAGSSPQGGGIALLWDREQHPACGAAQSEAVAVTRARTWCLTGDDPQAGRRADVTRLPSAHGRA